MPEQSLVRSLLWRFRKSCTASPRQPAAPRYTLSPGPHTGTPREAADMFIITSGSGEGGIRSARFPQLIRLLCFLTQLEFCLRLAVFRLLLVDCGCLALFGISFSTISAQFFGTEPSPRHELWCATVPITRCSRGTAAARKGKLPSGAGQGGDESHLRCGSYARYSSDSQNDASIDDQQRQCCDFAPRNGHTISTQLQFEDRAVSGTKLHREGLDRMLAAAEAGQIDVLYFYSLSRLARESVITMPMLKKLVHVNHVRGISVIEGIDSARTEWDVLATIFSLQHERFIKELSANVFRGQEGTVLAGFSVGDYCFGYKSEPVPGTEVGRRGRNAKPRMRYVIDPETAPWVQRIFFWFVVEKRSMRWIARELNRLGAPKDHRATTHRWTHQLVSTLLRRMKYVGIWPWSGKKNVRNPLTGQVHQEDRLAEETDKWIRRFPELQIIDTTVFAAAQVLLEEYDRLAEGRRRPNGQLGGSVSGNSKTAPRHLLANLLRCEKCESVFHVGGGRARYLSCSNYKTGGTCTCKTMVLRTVAERIILQVIGQRILGNHAWREAVQAAAVAAHRKQENELPSAIKDAEAALAAVNQKITRLVDQVEAGVAPPEVNDRLAKRRAEKRDLEDALARLRNRDDQRMPDPTPEWIDQQFEQLESVLVSGGPAAALALRALVGGVVWVREVDVAHSDRRRLEARFSIRTATVAQALASPTEVPVGDATPAQPEYQEEIIVELREPDVVEQIAQQVKDLWEMGLTIKAIAQRVGRNRNLVKDALLLWHSQRGLPAPDTQDHKRTPRKPLLADTLFERIMELWHQGMPHGQIATECNCDNSIITTVVKKWHEQRNLPVPDGRTRRKLLRQSRNGSEADAATVTSSESSQASGDAIARHQEPKNADNPSAPKSLAPPDAAA